MTFVRVPEGGFEGSLKRFRRLCDKAGILTDIRRKRYHIKDTKERKLRKEVSLRRRLKHQMRETIAPVRGPQSRKPKPRRSSPMSSERGGFSLAE